MTILDMAIRCQKLDRLYLAMCDAHDAWMADFRNDVLQRRYRYYASRYRAYVNEYKP